MAILIAGFAVIGVLALLSVGAVVWVIRHPEPPADFGPDSKLNT